MPRTPAQPRPDTQSVVYFDGACPLCRAEIGFYQNRDQSGALRFVDVSDAEAQLPDDLSREDALRRFHVRSASGALTSGAAGFAELWSRLPGWRILARIARLPVIRSLLEVAYRAFLLLRPAIVRVFTLVTKGRAT